MNPVCQRGDIYYANLGSGIGSEQVGSRPVVIIQNNIGNSIVPLLLLHLFPVKSTQRQNFPFIILSEQNVDWNCLLLYS